MNIPKVVTALLLLLSIHLSAFDAAAALTDQQANQQIDNAINTHYASADIDVAEKKLLDVIKACANSCSPNVVARAWMYVGIVRGSGRDDAAGAGEAFTAAKAADPAVQLDDLFATDMVRRVFAQTAGAGLMIDMKSRAATQEPVSAIICSLTATEVETQRPIPISCRTPAGTQSVVLSYKHESWTRWRSVPMTQSQGAYVAEIPCAITTQIGVLAYHVQALDARGQSVDTLGDEQEPQELSLVQTTDAAPPALPNQPPPASCRPKKAPEPKGPTLGTYGDACKDSSQCQGGLTCSDGKCTADVSCESDADCASGVCIDSVCQLPDCEGDDCTLESRAPKNWFGVQGGFDFAWMSGTNVCAQGADPAYACFEDGNPYVGVPNSNYGGSIDSGFRPATARIMLSYERALSSVFAVEGRFGFAFNGGPESERALGGDGSKFLPYHAEGRVKVYFTRVYRDDGSGLRGPSGFVMLGGGLAQVDPHVTVQVGECRINRVPPAVPGDPVLLEPQEGACVDSANRVFEINELDVYQRLGQGFVSGGVGFRYGFGRHVAAVATVNAQFLFPSTGFTLSPSVGVTAGF
ncbi:MAG TPA: hypothetical protein VNN80_35725 [Polyangiaceae bacterium]|nr:hypothetical protein [Polyangiaceae bacterium]